MAQGYTGGNVTPPGTGQVVQVVNTSSSAYASLGSATLPADNSTPQLATETNAIAALSTSITPSSSSNKLLIEVSVCLSNAGASDFCYLLLSQDSTNTPIQISGAKTQDANAGKVTLIHYMTAGTTSAITFKAWAGNQSGAALHINGTSSLGTGIFNGTMSSSMTITEIKA